MFFYFYHVAMVLSLVVSFIIVVLMWQRRQSPASMAMLALAAATFVWTLGFLLEANSNTLERQLLFNNIGYIGSMSVPVAWFFFSLRYTNIGGWLSGRSVMLFCVIPVVTVVLVWTNQWHHLMWSDEHLVISGAFLVTTKIYGPFFWVALAYNYILIISGSAILVRRLFIGTPLFTGQAVSLIIAVGLPLLWNILFIFDVLPIPRKDMTPVMFAASGIVIILGVVRFRLLTTVPFAREYIIQQLNDGIFVFDISNRLVDVNPAAMNMLQADRSIIGKRPEELLSVSPLFGNLSPVGFETVEFRLKVNGEDRFYELKTLAMIDSHEVKIGRLVILHDVTGRRLAEEQYRLVAEHTADVIYKYSLKGGDFTYVSPSATRLFGYTETEAMTLKLEDILTPESNVRQSRGMIESMKNGQSEATLLLDVVHKDGHIIPVEVHARMVYDKNGEPSEIVGVVRDITTRRKMEEQLIMQDRLASIGALTSGVAHEINNPLTGIISFSSLLLQKELPEDVAQDIKTINEEAQRAATIVKDLLTFSRKQPQEKLLTNINESVQKVLGLRSYQQKESKIRVNADLDPDLPLVLANSSQLQQVFFNVIINAEYFMYQAHQKGVLTITTKRVDDCVRVSVADNGPGISQENLRHLFQPFFTTKEVGKGTGLGLSICQGIVAEHGGRIWADSEPGKGAVFFIELPVYPGSEADLNHR
ncbi:MAG: PAS domain S-box protein [Dehalococcoidales bacterium]|nr:PAS domain S-box protein [Dehalococcoidales bacterium]